MNERFAEMPLPEKLALAADNIERARATGDAKQLAGWEHLAIRESLVRIDRLRVATEAAEAAELRREGRSLMRWLARW